MDAHHDSSVVRIPPGTTGQCIPSVTEAKFNQMRLLLATYVAAAVAQRGATPSGHALLLGTQRTGTTWAMAELDRSPCVSTTSKY